tara:strand:+ start:1429 stop:1989 length:561 start_codon:yes stop_codon:yes gene_type:complete
MVKINSCIFISGNGSNFFALSKRSNNYNFPIKVSLVVSDNPDAKGLKIAKKMGIPYRVFNKRNLINETKLIKLLKEKKISLILLAGYMKILSKKFIKQFDNKILNIHPSLLPKFKGLNTYERILKNNEKRAGCTVHYVNEKLDSGKIILQKKFYIKKDDDVVSLKRKTQNLEYVSYSEAIIKIFRK